jgi:hypothetical protein
LRPENGHVVLEDLGYCDGHGAVYKDQDRGNPFGPDEGVEVVQHLLGPLDGEGRNDQVPAPFDGVVDDGAQFFLD